MISGHSLVLLLCLFALSFAFPTSSFSARFKAISRQNPALSFEGLISARKDSTWTIDAISRDVTNDIAYIYTTKETTLVSGLTGKCEKQRVRGPPLIEHIEKFLQSEPIEATHVYDKQIQQCLDESLQLRHFEFEGETVRSSFFIVSNLLVCFLFIETHHW
jgi:hypothetical protein